MIRKGFLTSLAIALAAANFAAAAQASELHTASGSNTSIFGTQLGVHSFEFGAGTAKCNQALFEATQAGSGGAQTTTNELTVTPTYTGCTVFGLASTIEMNGCKYTVTGAGQPALTSSVDIVGCTTGKTMTIKISAIGCEVTILQINGLVHITHSNIGGSPPHVTDQITLAKIQYEAHKCEPLFPETVKMSDLKIGGHVTTQARADTGTELVTHNGHQYNKLKQTGALVGLQAT